MRLVPECSADGDDADMRQSPRGCIQGVLSGPSSFMSRVVDNSDTVGHGKE